MPTCSQWPYEFCVLLFMVEPNSSTLQLSSTVEFNVVKQYKNITSAGLEVNQGSFSVRLWPCGAFCHSTAALLDGNGFPGLFALPSSFTTATFCRIVKHLDAEIVTRRENGTPERVHWWDFSISTLLLGVYLLSGWYMAPRGGGYKKCLVSLSLMIPAAANTSALHPKSSMELHNNVVIRRGVPINEKHVCALS